MADNEQAQATRELNATIVGLKETLRASQKAEIGVQRSMNQLRAGLPLFLLEFTTAMKGLLLTEFKTSLLEVGEIFQRSTLQFGMTVSEVANMNGKLGEQVGGFTTTMASRLAMVGEGLQGYGKEVALLTSRSAALGEGQVQTARFLKSLTVHLGMNVKAVNAAAEMTRVFSNTFNISSQKLIQAVETLNPSVKTLAAFMGGGEGLVASVQKAVAFLGPGSEGLVASFVNAFASPTTRGAIEAQLMGISGARRGILGGGGADLIQTIEKVGERFMPMLKSIQDSGGDIGIGFEILRKVFGETAVTGTKLYLLLKNMTPAQRKIATKQLEVETKFNETLGMLYQEAILPLKEFITSLPWKEFFGYMKENMPILKTIAITVASLAAILTAGSIIKFLLSGVLSVLAFVVNTVIFVALPIILAYMAANYFFGTTIKDILSGGKSGLQTIVGLFTGGAGAFEEKGADRQWGKLQARLESGSLAAQLFSPQWRKALGGPIGDLLDDNDFVVTQRDQATQLANAVEFLGKMYEEQKLTNEQIEAMLKDGIIFKEELAAQGVLPKSQLRRPKTVLLGL